MRPLSRVYALRNHDAADGTTHQRGLEVVVLDGAGLAQRTR